MTDEKRYCCSNSTANDDAVTKDYVKEKYGQIASGVKGQGKASCCGDAAKDPITADLYSEAEAAGVPADALLASLGCGNPTALAELKPGEVVLDLGSGGGIDVLLSARRVGPTGKAYGLDMTDEMLALARKNQKAAGVENVEFLKGEIESVPLPDNSVDVIISNCVINLSTDKDAVLREAFRVLRPGGRFAVADIVMVKPISQEAQNQLALWAGCIAGALTMDDYKAKLANAGFGGIDIQVVRTYEGADMASLLGGDCCCGFGEANLDELKTSIVSAFIRAVKP